MPHKVATSTNVKIQYFSDLGLFRIFYETQDESILESIAKSTLSSIIADHSIHNSEYFETLKVYLNHGSSILETALIMNTHRNTINYRMRKIREILGKDLDDQIFNLMLAYNIMDYLDISTLRINFVRFAWLDKQAIGFIFPIQYKKAFAFLLCKGLYIIYLILLC